MCFNHLKYLPEPLIFLDIFCLEPGVDQAPLAWCERKYP